MDPKASTAPVVRSIGCRNAANGCSQTAAARRRTAQIEIGHCKIGRMYLDPKHKLFTKIVCVYGVSLALKKGRSVLQSRDRHLQIIDGRYFDDCTCHKTLLRQFEN